MNEYKRSAIAHNISANLGVEFGAAWRIATCMCKRQYATKERAESFGVAWAQRAYLCEVCGRWHLTGTPEKGDLEGDVEET